MGGDFLLLKKFFWKEIFSPHFKGRESPYGGVAKICCEGGIHAEKTEFYTFFHFFLILFFHFLNY